MRFQSILVVAALVALMVPAGADNNRFPCEMISTIYVPHDAESESFPVYVMMDTFMSSEQESIWIYAEWNGREGLQRHDAYCAHEGIGPEDADLIVF